MSVTERAEGDAHAHRPLPSTGFLGGLLPSRARFRLAGSLPIPVHMKLAQSRCPQFPCLADGVQSSKASQNMVAYRYSLS
jgi:hypothetical protein